MRCFSCHAVLLQSSKLPEAGGRASGKVLLPVELGAFPAAGPAATPSPATYAMLRLWKAGERVVQTHFSGQTLCCMHLEEQSHCFLHVLASQHCLGHFWAPPVRKPGLRGEVTLSFTEGEEARSVQLTVRAQPQSATWSRQR